MKNINTETYWNNRFATGDWEEKKGRSQTEQFALSQIPLFKIPPEFNGTILDFGCGLGDAFPFYKSAFPSAKLIGLDISEAAINKCKQKFGDIGQFICGDYTIVQDPDIIIASNVFEHLSDDILIAKKLLQKCKKLYIVVPYKERLLPGNEHVNSYSEEYFKELGKFKYTIFKSRGWGLKGFSKIYHIHFKNLFRPFFGKKFIYNGKQIMFYFDNESI